MKKITIKRILAVLLTFCIAAMMSGCMTTTTTTTVTDELTVSEEAAEPDMSDYTDDYAGLVQYLKDCEVLVGEGSEMSADFIGAEEGAKFAFKYNSVTITCELYYFDLENLNETGEQTLAQLKEEGTFKSLNGDVEAKLSNSGKFMMIYTNNSEDDAQVSLKSRTEEKFMNFVGGRTPEGE